MSVQEQHLSTLVAEQRRPGFSRLRFTRFVEEQFRTHYGEINHPKVRLLLVLAACGICLSTGYALALSNVSMVTAIFDIVVMLPLLTATFLASFQLERHRLYQPLLAVSMLCIGLIVTSVALRASLHGTPYYFAAIVAWVFTIWLSVGLLFGYAAVTAITISLAYGFGLVYWNFGHQESLFAGAMLIGVNALGALCCFQLEATTRAAYRDKRILEDLAERDGLTGLYNRRAYDGYMERIWRQSRREESQLTVMLIDIDHFKTYNDLYGHQAGDDALKRVAAVIAMGAQRPLDLAARFGGEEFALVLYGQANDFGRNLPDHIRQRVVELGIPHAESSTGPVLTVSIGVSIVTPGAERSLAGAVQMADEALYQAKEEGRNRVVVNESRLTHIQTGRFRAYRKRAV
ncbi:MAG: GGDEF domain-containing protein [Gammaproteobacteria bacterium]|nr:GGDEF domain-containing protein [Gammaproteobacteria bacterium]